MRTIFAFVILVACNNTTWGGPESGSLTPEQKAAWERARKAGSKEGAYVYAMVGVSDPKWMAARFAPKSSNLVSLDPSVKVGTSWIREYNLRGDGISAAFVVGELQRDPRVAYVAVVDLFSGNEPKVLWWAESGERLKGTPPAKVVESFQSHIRKVQQTIGD